MILNSGQFYNRLMSDEPGTADKNKLVLAAEEDMTAAVTESQSLQLEQSLRSLLEATGFSEDAEQLSSSLSASRRTIAPSRHRGTAQSLHESDREELERGLRFERSINIRTALLEEYRVLRERRALLEERRAGLLNDLRFQNDSHKRALLRKQLDLTEAEMREVDERMEDVEYSMSMLVDNQ